MDYCSINESKLSYKHLFEDLFNELEKFDMISFGLAKGLEEELNKKLVRITNEIFDESKDYRDIEKQRKLDEIYEKYATTYFILRCKNACLKAAEIEDNEIVTAVKLKEIFEKTNFEEIYKNFDKVGYQRYLNNKKEELTK